MIQKSINQSVILPIKQQKQNQQVNIISNTTPTPISNINKIQIKQKQKSHSKYLEDVDSIQKAKAIYLNNQSTNPNYKSPKYKYRYSQNSQYKVRGHSRNTDHSNNHFTSQIQELKQKYASSGVDLLNKSAEPPLVSLLKKSKMITQSQDVSLNKKFHNKTQKQRRYQNGHQNDRMMKRLSQIKNRKNKYIIQAQELMQFQKQHKIMHESSIMANKKLQQLERQQQNDKFIDRLVERVNYKQTIKPKIKEKILKSVKLQESRMKVAIGNRNFVQLPPMVFD